jgi:hypothetical protein
MLSLKNSLLPNRSLQDLPDYLIFEKEDRNDKFLAKVVNCYYPEHLHSLYDQYDEICTKCIPKYFANGYPNTFNVPSHNIVKCYCTFEIERRCIFIQINAKKKLFVEIVFASFLT